MEFETPISESVSTPQTQPKTFIKSKLLFKLREEHYQQQVRNELMKRMRRLNGIRNKTMQELTRANNALYLGRISKMKRHELEGWEEYIDKLNAKEKRVTEDLQKYEKTEHDIYLCCSDEIREYFLEVGSKLKEAIPSSRLEDIYSALIMTAYSLLSEVYDDMLTTQHLDENAFDLYLKIASGDIIYNGENLSSQIRRFLFGLKPDTIDASGNALAGGRIRKTRVAKRKSARRKTSTRKNATRNTKKR